MVSYSVNYEENMKQNEINFDLIHTEERASLNIFI